jgi:hypothetical protein
MQGNEGRIKVVRTKPRKSEQREQQYLKQTNKPVRNRRKKREWEQVDSRRRMED